MSVTWVPSRAKAWAISQPIGPAPMIASRRGCSVNPNSVSFVRYGTAARPGIGGTAGRPPVAITARRNVSVLPATSIADALVNRASPK